MRQVARLLCGGFFLFLASPVALAEDEQLFDQYSLQAQAEGEVVNDLVTVELSVQDEDQVSSSLANRINATMEWALEKLRSTPAVTHSTRNYRTWPKYERNQRRIVGWHASQTLLLESDDFAVVRRVVQQLQEKLRVNAMRMTPKHTTRIERENTLITDALNRFKERAEIIQLNMGAADYRVVEVSVNTDQQFNQFQPRMMERSVSSSMVESAPAIAGGSSKIVVHVSGRIQLQ